MGLNEKSASEREQRQVYLNVAEREQIQDRRAGLKEKGEMRKEKGEPPNEARAEGKLVCTMPCKEAVKTAKQD